MVSRGPGLRAQSPPDSSQCRSSPPPASVSPPCHLYPFQSSNIHYTRTRLSSPTTPNEAAKAQVLQRANPLSIDDANLPRNSILGGRGLEEIRKLARKCTPGGCCPRFFHRRRRLRLIQGACNGMENAPLPALGPLAFHPTTPRLCPILRPIHH